jgi:hypothetical protein
MTRRDKAQRRLRTAVGRLAGTSPLAWSRWGYTGGCAVASSGVGVQFGLGWALMVAGVWAAASFLLLVDVDGKGDGG